MVLKQYIKILTGTFSFLTMTVLFSCEKLDLFVKCDECTLDKPTEIDLEINLSDKYGYSIVRIYVGNLEDSVLYTEITTSMSVISWNVPLNNKYTLTAEYTISGITYTTVNSVNPYSDYIENQCTDPCYYVRDNLVDLRLKYHR